jgi:branched-subunit amino acid ABC-type transport system permease component
MQFLIDALLRSGDLILVTLGLSTVYALVRFPNLAQVEYATVGAFLALLFAGLGAPLWIAAAAAAILTGVLAVVLHRAIFAHLLRVGPAIAMIGSLAVAMIIRALIQAIGGTRSQRFDLPIEMPHQVLGAGITNTQLMILGITAVIVTLFFLLLFRTGLGRSMRAVAAQPTLAKASGIDSERVVDVICFLGGLFAAFGGVLLAVGSQVYFNLGQDLLLPVFAAAIVGGLGSPAGAVAGALLLAFVETVITNFNFGFLIGEPLAFVPLAYGPAAGFALLVLTLLTRPRGLLFKATSRV